MEEKTYNLAKICAPAVSQLDDFCQENNLTGLLKADLVCITCSSKEIYDNRRSFYDTESRFLYQAIISSRRIVLVGLKEFIPTSIGDIRLLEITDQKPDNSQTDRLTHIGVVPNGISYDELIAKLKASGVVLEEIARSHGYVACKVTLPTGFCIRIQKEPLLERVKRDEMI